MLKFINIKILKSPQLYMKKNKQNDDYVLITTAVLLLILSGFLVFWFSPNQFLPSARAPKIIGEASLTIDFGNGEKRAFEGEVVEGETLVHALGQAAKAGNFSYKLDGKNNLAAIDDFSVSKNKSWLWYLNGEKINKPINEISLKSGDKILIKHE